MKELSSTSYAILALLAVRPWSAYELAGQMSRGFRNIWPRAESAIYQEPKILVAHGLAKASSEPAGPRRRRTVYSITATGRRALRAWLAQASEPPKFESESHVRTLVADQGTKDDLLRTLRDFAEFGAEMRRAQVAQLEDYLAQGRPFPDRWHVIALVSRFMGEYACLAERWAKWAEAEVRRWPSIRPSDAQRRGAKLFKESIAMFRDEDLA